MHNKSSSTAGVRQSTKGGGYVPVLARNTRDSGSDNARGSDSISDATKPIMHENAFLFNQMMGGQNIGKAPEARADVGVTT